MIGSPFAAVRGRPTSQPRHAEQQRRHQNKVKLLVHVLLHSLHRSRLLHLYSQRKAIIGSTREALLAGRKPASEPTPTISSAASASVSESPAVRPKSMDESNRPAASDTHPPMATPTITSEKVSRSTALSTPPGCAPSAMRIPIS